MKNLPALLLFLLPMAGPGQTYYLSTAANEIYQLEADYSATFLTEVNGLNRPITDIAVAPDGSLYGVVRDLLIRIDLTDGSYEEIFLIPSPIVSTIVTSLTCTSAYELIGIDNTNRRLLRYDLVTDSLSVLATNEQFVTPGDVTLYRGNILFPSGPHIKAYRLADGSITNAFCLPANTNSFYGIGADFTACEAGPVLATSTADDVFTFNLEDGTLDYEPATPPDLYIYGFAAANEYLHTDCDYQFPDDSCPTSSVARTPRPDAYTVYPNPFQHYLHLPQATRIQEVEILSATGASVFRQQHPATPLDLSWLPPGCYFLRLHTTDGLINQTVIKQ
ncbi:MAG: T9SS type A sorting domain-containing protein [Lewinella sp.]|nr:T9SS type A sorting domain-containing protein [Lewinella sp.]